MDVWRIEVPDGVWNSARVFLNGKPLHSVLEASVDVKTGELVTATFKVENVEVDIGALQFDESTAAGSG